jgi:hypothetical protein
LTAIRVESLAAPDHDAASLDDSRRDADEEARRRGLE